MWQAVGAGRRKASVPVASSLSRRRLLRDKAGGKEGPAFLTEPGPLNLTISSPFYNMTPTSIGVLLFEILSIG